jgi:phage shock protein C
MKTEPKKLRRPSNSKIDDFFGVCWALANYTNSDRFIFQIIFLALFVHSPLTFWLYILLALLIPREANTSEKKV